MPDYLNLPARPGFVARNEEEALKHQRLVGKNYPVRIYTVKGMFCWAIPYTDYLGWALTLKEAMECAIKEYEAGPPCLY